MISNDKPHLFLEDLPYSLACYISMLSHAQPSHNFLSQLCSSIYFIVNLINGNNLTKSLVGFNLIWDLYQLNRSR